MEKILSVTDLTRSIKFLLESSFNSLWVAGEISNLRCPGSGHLYLTLKDEHSQIRGVVFRQALRNIRFDLEDGMNIVCRGRVNVYPVRGEYQLIIDAAEPRGLGVLQMAFEQLKKRLEIEGLFDSSKKKKIPFLPQRVGIITSPSGAAIRDILNITGRRFSSIDILIAPVRVQGIEAPPEIIEALTLLNSIPDIDVIILTRGGGSIEDLFSFNDEGVARAIYNSRIPVISAVGHEIDFTIADFVADLRAPTPSAAAELVVPNRKDLIEGVQSLRHRLLKSQERFKGHIAERLSTITARMKDPGRQVVDLRISLDDLVLRLDGSLRNGIKERNNRIGILNEVMMRMNPTVQIRNYSVRVENIEKDMLARFSFYVETLKHRIQKDVAMMDSLSPLSVLKRGYSIVRKLPSGMIVKEARLLTEGDCIDVRVSRGSFKAKVTKVSKV